ncbi:hypothetical protein D9M73_197160 [compost metagenome]
MKLRMPLRTGVGTPRLYAKASGPTKARSTACVALKDSVLIAAIGSFAAFRGRAMTTMSCDSSGSSGGIGAAGDTMATSDATRSAVSGAISETVENGCRLPAITSSAGGLACTSPSATGVPVTSIAATQIGMLTHLLLSDTDKGRQDRQS